MTSDVSNFGNLLRAHRRRVGMSQEELASRSQLSARSISNIELGVTHIPHPSSVRRLADALKLIGQQRDNFFAGANDVPASENSQDAPGDGGATPNLIEPTGKNTSPLPVIGGPLVGREAEVANLTNILQASITPNAAAPAIVTMEGPPGMGKTMLAVRWTYLMAARFKLGYLYADLHSADQAAPVRYSDVFASFLQSLGAPASVIPSDVAEAAAMYRSLLARRETIVVLDNVRESSQVQPFLPTGPSCVVAVSSNSLASLATDNGAVRTRLRALSQKAALDLLRFLIGPKVAADHEAAVNLVNICQSVPLALKNAAELSLARPDVSLREVVEKLDTFKSFLDFLNVGTTFQSALARLNAAPGVAPGV